MEEIVLITETVHPNEEGFLLGIDRIHLQGVVVEVGVMKDGSVCLEFVLNVCFVMFSQIVKSVFRSTLRKASVFDKQPILKVSPLQCLFFCSVLCLLIHSDCIMRNLKISLTRNKTFVRNSFHAFWSNVFTSLWVIVIRHTIHSTNQWKDFYKRWCMNPFMKKISNCDFMDWI